VNAGSIELLASRADVWSFLAEPYHLADWWPGITGVEPDLRGFAAGARWKVIATRRNVFAGPRSKETLLLIREIDPVRALGLAPARDEARRRDPPARLRRGPYARHDRGQQGLAGRRAEAALRPLPDCGENLMLDLRYHVASLSAVFLALVVGILVGIGISGRGFVDKSERRNFENRIAALQTRADQLTAEKGLLSQQGHAAESFVEDTYPVLMRNRLAGKRIAVIVIGPSGGATGSDVSRALADAGGSIAALPRRQGAGDARAAPQRAEGDAGVQNAHRHRARARPGVGDGWRHAGRRQGLAAARRGAARGDRPPASTGLSSSSSRRPRTVRPSGSSRVS